MSLEMCKTEQCNCVHQRSMPAIGESSLGMFAWADTKKQHNIFESFVDWKVLSCVSNRGKMC